MAELVQKHLESMVEEIEELKRSKLYTPEQAKQILNMRKEYEYKINGVSKNKQDFQDYINYEKMVLKQIHTTFNKNVNVDRRNAIEYKIIRRIKNLYEIGLQRFSNDVSFYLSYFKFCKQSNFINAANVAVQNMIKNYAQDPKIWQIAASWYANDRNDLNNALKILNKGLTLHKNNQELYTEAIKLELSMLKCNSISEEDRDLQVKVCKKIETYVTFICDCINDTSYLIKILNLLEPYGFTVGVQNLIIDRLLQSHSTKEFVWHTLAQREKRGLHHGVSSEEIETSGDTSLTLCFAKYEEGLQKVDQTEKAVLFSKYLDCLLRAQHEDKRNEVATIAKTKQALENASEENILTENYYIKWLEFVSSDQEALNILKKGTKNSPQSLDLWKLQLRYAIMSERNVEVDKVFKEGVEKLDKRSLPLWYMYLRYYSLMSRDDVISDTYQKATKHSPEISDNLKPRYIEWIALSKGMKEAREKYNTLAQEQPFCKELHLTMSKLESAEIDHNYETWGKVHELACKQFGEDDVDVWINHILFYLHFRKSDVNEKVETIYREAEAKLAPLLKSEFKEKYNKALSEQ